MQRVNLKPCPFCGIVPRMFGQEVRDYIQPETEEEENELTDNGWAKKSRKEFWIYPRCFIGCEYGSAHASAYPVTQGRKYKTPEAAAKAWNKRAEAKE